ncbi:MAG: hypothetical protein JRG73_17865 [Deltaproteobacteria bacterium]|nr:hypothetical protein [Deltaproteobacteria bacterium]MBW2308793.1 hypothetical protein [Deltaproteobacteria bacterium]
MELKNGRKLWMIFFVILASMGIGGQALAEGQHSFFEKSLHFTGEGMRLCYERDDGLMSITKIPYAQLDCKNCHVQTCDACHAEQRGKKLSYTTTRAKDMETCLKCHSRAGLTFKFGKEQGKLDLHVAEGMTCAECHKGEDVHGDGGCYHSMRAPEALKVSCATCHTPDKTIEAHQVHGDKLDCAACHVSNTVACMNCHFDTFLKTGSRKGIFFPMQSWLLLINYNGKVTSGTAMSIVSKNQKFVVYAPYYTHAIQKKGRVCSDCHANAAMKLIEKGQSVPMMVFAGGKVKNWEGVAPAVPEKLQWVYLNREGDTWIPLAPDAPEKIQWWYGTSLTEEQIGKLTTHYERRQQ